MIYLRLIGDPDEIKAAICDLYTVFQVTHVSKEKPSDRHLNAVLRYVDIALKPNEESEEAHG